MRYEPILVYDLTYNLSGFYIYLLIAKTFRWYSRWYLSSMT
jgi:hypothetical protein